MRWVTTRVQDQARVGLIDGDQILLIDDDRAMADVVAGGLSGLADLAATLRRAPGGVVETEEAALLSPIPKPPAVRDALCFLEHMRGCMRALGRSTDLSEAWSQIPAFYFGNPACVLGPYDDVAMAPGSTWFDLELEVAAVIGEGGRDLSPADAEKNIIGYTFFCDWSARDLQLKDLELGLGQGKGKDSGITLGPWLVTADEAGEHRVDGRLALEVAASVNGKEFARGSTADMDWSFTEVLAFASRGTDLAPGDVIGSGTVPGGCLLEHVQGNLDTFDRWLVPGDTVSLYGDVLGHTNQLITAGADVQRLRTGF